MFINNLLTQLIIYLLRYKIQLFAVSYNYLYQFTLRHFYNYFNGLFVFLMIYCNQIN